MKGSCSFCYTFGLIYYEDFVMKITFVFFVVEIYTYWLLIFHDALTEKLQLFITQHQILGSRVQAALCTCTLSTFGTYPDMDPCLKKKHCIQRSGLYPAETRREHQRIQSSSLSQGHTYRSTTIHELFTHIRLTATPTAAVMSMTSPSMSKSWWTVLWTAS